MSDVILHAPFAGWLGPLSDVPDPVFAERMMGDGVAIDPVEGLVRAPADGEVVTIPASGHAVTLRLANGADVLIHVGLDSVALGGAGFRPEVAIGDRVRRGDTLIAFDLDTVARGACDLVTPLVVTSAGGRIAMLGEVRHMVEAGTPIATVSIDRPSVADDDKLRIVAERRLAVTAPHGLHARPAARIVALLGPFAARVQIALGDRLGDAGSVTDLLALGARQGDVLTASASGVDAEAALTALADFAERRFGDPEDVGASIVPESPHGEGGVCAVPGLAIGHIRQFHAGDVAVIEDSMGAAAERATLDAAIRRVDAAQGPGDIAEAHRAILNDPRLHDAAMAGIGDGLSAGMAWRCAIRAAADRLRATGDARLAERIADLVDVERQILVALGGIAAPPPTLEPNTILIAEELLPSQFLSMASDRLAGICTAAGGATSHVAILAAAAGIPMVVAMGPDVLAHADGSAAILDAGTARLTVDPDPQALADAASRIARHRALAAEALAAAQEPCVMADGMRIEVFANLGSVEDAAAAVAAGAEGCGLLRTEFLFLDREDAPDEAEQRSVYGRIAAVLGERPLIVRTLDIGGDKPVAYLPRQPEENPALGERGVRLSLRRPDMLATQLRAILTAVPGRQCRIMVPMIVDRSEIRKVRALLDRAIADTGRSDPVELGIMIETPAAAMLADQLAAEVDFLSVGTNDLTQYALAADRGNASVAAMIDALHPAVLRLIARAAEGAKRHGRWIGICGGLASDPGAAALLVGLGASELSAVPEAVPAVKAALRRTTMTAATALAERALAMASAGEIRALLTEESA